jgi:hypothetical protein
MTSLELGMAFLLGLTVLTAVSALALPGDPMRLTRVLLAVGSAILFQVHVIAEGIRPEHWPLYVAGLLVLVIVAGHWFFSQPSSAAPGGDERDDDGGA